MLDNIVGQVFSEHVVQIGPDASIEDAIEKMAYMLATYVIICERNTPTGILTARDIPRLFDLHTDLSQPVQNVMSQPVATCCQDISLLDALDMMLDKGIRHIPVVNEQLTLLGMISESHIMDSLGSADLMRSQKVVEIMKTEVVRTLPHTPFSEVMDIFLTEKIGSLIVAEGDLPLGIITERDFPRLIAARITSDTPAEQIMSKPLITISVHATAQDALLKLHHGHIHHLPVTGPSGNLKGIISRSCFFHDLGRYLIRKLVMAERRVKALSLLQEDYLPRIENFYLEATENAPHGIVVYKFGTIIYANKSALKMFGIAQKREFIGHQIEDVFPSDGNKGELDKLLEQDQGLNDEVFQLCRPDGTPFTAEVSSTIIVFEGEAATLLTLKDISEQQALEERFRQAQKMEAVGTLAGGIAHDFNNMLAGITGNIFLVKSRVESDPVLKQKLADIESLCFKAAEVVSQLLTFSRKGEVKMQRLSMAPFVKETLKLVRVGIPENIHLLSDITSEVLIVQGDATQLNQIIINLLNNARDALAAVTNPQIKVSLQKWVPDERFRLKHMNQDLAESFAHLTIVDNGPGISSLDMEKVFEPFFTTKEEGKGTGLGLAMVYGAIQSHGGIIEVESVMAQGTSFHVYLPLQSAVSTTIAVNDSAAVVEGSGELILLADDDERVLSATQEVLEHIGYQVITASNGAEAVVTFKTNMESISLVISDIVMPVLGGIEAVAQMKALKPELPVLFTSGYADAQIYANHEAVDQHQIVTKPVHTVLLSQRIRDALTQ